MDSIYKIQMYLDGEWKDAGHVSAERTGEALELFRELWQRVRNFMELRFVTPNSIVYYED